jgi:hypothetical protein
MVRIHPDPPVSYRGCSSVGRAPALQAGGHRFDPVHLHHFERKKAADEEGDRHLNQNLERSKASHKACFWSFDRRGCSLFNNLEEASVLISQDQHMGCDCIQNGSALVGWSRHKRENSYGRKASVHWRGSKVIGSSEQVHMVDALAITGDEGRSSLR